jgi:hypothetical protein
VEGVRWTLQLGCWSSGGFDDGNGFGPFGGDSIALLHGETGVMDKHLCAFAAAPGEVVQKMFLAHVLCAGRGIDFGLAALDQTAQFIHGKDYSMQDRRSDFQPVDSRRVDCQKSYR